MYGIPMSMEAEKNKKKQHSNDDDGWVCGERYGGGCSDFSPFRIRRCLTKVTQWETTVSRDHSLACWQGLAKRRRENETAWFANGAAFGKSAATKLNAM